MTSSTAGRSSACAMRWPLIAYGEDDAVGAGVQQLALAALVLGAGDDQQRPG